MSSLLLSLDEFSESVPCSSRSRNCRRNDEEVDDEDDSDGFFRETTEINASALFVFDPAVTATVETKPALASKSFILATRVSGFFRATSSTSSGVIVRRLACWENATKSFARFVVAYRKVSSVKVRMADDVIWAPSCLDASSDVHIRATAT